VPSVTITSTIPSNKWNTTASARSLSRTSCGSIWSKGKEPPEILNRLFPRTSTGRRTALAKWITDPRHPLTARVAVNHIWNRHFGSPLVATLSDFGRKGAKPLHPELLDWLATELISHQWSMKYLHRLIVTSSTYRLGSTTIGRDANVALDEDNRFWWRRAPMRLESQVIRDSVLSVAGQLEDRVGGPSVAVEDQAESHRRSIYFYHSNNDRNLFLTAFDDATVQECYRRDESIVPQQALALANSRLSHDIAQQIVDQPRFSDTRLVDAEDD